MLILNSYNSKSSRTKASDKLNLDLINFNSSKKTITRLESNDNVNNNNKKSFKTNKNQFLKIKKLITEFEQEKNEQEKLHRLKAKKNKYKNKVNKTNKKNKIEKNFSKSPPNIFIPNKKVYFNVPKIKSQMQFNRYLINDFKENDSEMDFIKRSKKYQKINEDYEELVLMKQIKEVAKNGISENVVDDYQKNEQDIFDTPDSDLKSNNSFKHYLSKDVSEFKVGNVSQKNNKLNLNLRRMYTEKIKLKEIQNILKKTENKKQGINQNNTQNNTNNTNITSNNNFTARTKVSEKENSFNEEKEYNNDINKSPGIKFLIGIKNNNNRHNEIRTKSKKITKSFDKYNFSERLYFSHMKEFNRYMRKKQYMRGKNFSKQIALINKEKEKLGIIDTQNEETNTERGLPKLIIPNLLFHIEYKDIFKNSFNTLRVFEEGDQDLDLDDLNKIKQSIKDYEMEMIKVLKKNNNLNYIKKRFNKTTVGKFQSTKGIYFGN